METQKLATETPVGPTSQTAGSDGQHVKITPPAPTKNSGGAWFLSFIFIIVIFGTGFLTWPHWQSYVMAYVPNSFDIGLEDPRVDGLMDRLGGLESEATSMRKRDTEIARLEGESEKLRHSLSGVLGRIEILEQSIDTLKVMVKAAGTAQEAAVASRGIKALNERLRKLETVGSTASSPVDNPKLAMQLRKFKQDRAMTQNLAQRVAQLEQLGTHSKRELAETLKQFDASRQAFQGLEERLAAVEEAPASANSNDSSVVILAVSELREAIHRGRAYTNELKAVKAAAVDEPEVRAALIDLEKYAAEGIRPLSDLREEFAKLAGTIVAADRSIPDTDWIGRALQRISSLVKFRRIDGAGEASSTDVLVARAEKYLANGDLQSAVSSIEQLDNSAKSTASSWLSRSKVRLGVEESLASLHARVVARLLAVRG